MELSDARSLFERSYSAWSRADVDALLELYEPDCVWDNTRIPIDLTLYRGHDGLRDAVAAWFSNWREFRVQMRDVTRLDEDRFLLEGAGSDTGRDSGVPVDLPPLQQIITTRGGRILAVRNYLDRDEALRDAGRA